MNVTLTSLEALILKATKETLPCPDDAALEAFAAVMRCSPEGPQLAAQALAARIHTPSPQKAMLALTMTDRCMRKCGADFHAEIGKFRFLNEMIKLVSPKYLADRTDPEVRTRVLQLLHAWSIEYPQEFKFKVAFDMLRNQGVVKETPPPLPPEGETSVARSKHAIFEDEEKSKLLQKLLQSKKPEDIQHANRLIKTMVREEERRTEANSRRAQEINTALDSASLLQDMLENADSASADEVSLIHELHAIIAKMRVVMDELGPCSIGEGDSLTEILDASSVLDEVHERYEAFCEGRKRRKSEKLQAVTHPKNESLLDFAGVNPASDGAGNTHEPKNVAKNAIDELGDIFASETASVNNVALLQPVNLMNNDDVDLLGEKPKVEGWNELDSLSEQLLKQSLPENAKRGDSFNGKTKKIPMNALTSPKHELPTQSAGPVYDLDFFTKHETKPQITTEPLPDQTTTNDVVMVDITEAPTNKSTILDIELATQEPIEAKCRSKSEVKPLTDINVTLESVQPSNVPPLTAFEEKDGLTVVFHFCKDKPRADVNVVVISTTSRSSSPIEDYKIQCVVPKGSKVRLLPASGTSLPVFNPFLPPPALTQVMLVARPAASPPIDLKFVMTYTLDEDVCSEMGEVKRLPLDDIQ